MSLRLDNVKPNAISASTITSNMFEHGGKTTLRLAGHEISMEEFRGLVIYTMCNTDLEENDPRLELLEDIQSLTVIEDRHGKRLDGLRPLPHHFAFR